MSDLTLDANTTDPPDAASEIALENGLVDPGALIIDAQPPTPLGRAAAYDFVQRQFVPGITGAPLMVYGLATLAQWAEKCLRTLRGAHPAVDPDFGLDRMFTDLLDGGPFDAGAAAEFEAIVDRALRVHPWISSVEDWQVSYLEGDDAAFCSFTIIPAVDDLEPTTLQLPIPIGAS